MHLNIKILAVGDPPADPHIKPFAEATMEHLYILEKGTASGRTSIAILSKLPDGRFVTMQMTAGIFLAAAGAVRGACERFGDKESLS